MVQQDTNPISNIVEKARAESIKTISLLGILGSWVAVAACLFVGLPTGDSRYYILTAIFIVLALCLSVVNFLANRNKTSMATWLSIFAIEIVFIAISIMIANLGVILAIILVIVIGSLAMAWQSFSTRTAIISIMTGIVASIATLLVDLLSLNPLHIVPLNWLVAGVAIITGGIIILILGIELLRHYQFDSIRAQIIVAFIIISVVPLWTVVAPQLIANSSLLEDAAKKALSSSAADTWRDFDGKLNSFKYLNTSDAKLPVFVKFAQNSTGTADDILDYFQVMKNRDSSILSYGLLDKKGKILIDTRSAQIGVDESAEADFKNAVENQQSSLSDIRFDEAINKHVFYVSTPILNGNGEVSGVLRVEINADLFQTEFVEHTATGVTALLVDQNGIILANSSSPDTRFKSISPLNQEKLVELQQKRILSSGTAEDLTVNFLDLEKGLKQSDQNPFFRALLIPNSSEINVVTTMNLTNKPWKVVAGRPVSSFSEPANNQTRATIFIATIVMLVALVAATITSNLLTAPLNYLIAMSERIRRGELNVPIKLERGDEIGRLSETLHATALESRQTLATLESRAEERAADLATATENIRQSADQLRSIAEITRTITSIQNLDELLPEITRQISAVLGFYHVGIFLTDQAGQYAILQASNSEGGQKMLKKSHRLKVGHTGIVGFVTGTGQARIALDVGDDAAFFNNPDLPNTRSEIALPLRVGENIIGALDVQSHEASAFGSEDIGILSLLADQISIAIQNARLFEETRAALAEAQVFYRQSATASWRDILRQGTRGFRYLNGSIEAIKTTGETPKKAVGRSAEKQENIADSELLTIPINIRGKSLGTLKIRQTGRDHSWSDSETRVYQSIVDRISFALENARLYQDAQRRASKERVIGEITTKVSSSVNMDNILQTAVEELGRVLPGSEVVIQFEQEDETSA